MSSRLERTMCRPPEVAFVGRDHKMIGISGAARTLMSCARSRVSTLRATLFSTTFPCHNCAKHIIAAGIRRVVYVEPYPKSRAASFYKHSIVELDEVLPDNNPAERGETDGASTVVAPVSFEPFRGIGPRRFFDLFSLALGSGYRVKRKSTHGHKEPWPPGQARVRVPLFPLDYIQREASAADRLKEKTQE